MAETSMVAPAGGEDARARRLQWRMLIGFVAGLVAGLAVYYGAADAPWVDTVSTYVTGPIGQIFLTLLFLLVIPLLDRNVGVLGKSVPVLVILGGRRSIK